MGRRVLISIGGLFALFVASWLLYDRGVTPALLPIAVPAYLHFLTGQGTALMPVSLAVYALCLGIILRFLGQQSKNITIVVGCLLFIAHIALYNLMIKNFEEMGKGLGAQILKEHHPSHK